MLESDPETQLNDGHGRAVVPHTTIARVGKTFESMDSHSRDDQTQFYF